MSKAEEGISFETALTRIEEIVSLLENGNLPLEQSLKLFQEAATLAEGCTASLNAAQLEVEKWTSTQTDETWGHGI